MRWKFLLYILILAAPAAWSQSEQTGPQPKIEKGTGLVYSIPSANASPRDSHACPAKFTDGVEILEEKRQGILPPEVTHTKPAKFPREAREAMKKDHKKTLEAASLLSLVVTSEGLPSSICVKKPAGYGLDAEAIKTVQHYQFEPATKEGVPFPVRIFIEVNFKSN